MQKYLFILGRNWRLALAEIDTYLQLPEYKGRITDYSANVAVVEFDISMSIEKIGNLMVRLGSVQKIGQMYDFITRDLFEGAFPEEIEGNRAAVFDGREYLDKTLKDLIFELFPKIKNGKFFVATSIYPEEFSDDYYIILLKYFLHYSNKFFNTELKKQGAKSAIYYKYPQKNIDNGSLNPIFPHHFFKYELYKPNRVELLYCLTEEGMYIGKTITVVDSNFQKLLDEKRPQKDFRQTIPPKFAKTLISLLGLSEPLNECKILDPFCGAGTILQFGLMLGIDIFGSDIDPEKVNAARANVKYTAELMQNRISKQELSQKIIQSDIKELASKFKTGFFEGIVTEPVLLPYYQEIPSFDKVITEVNSEVIPKYQELLETSYKLLKPGARLGLVSPIVLTQEKRKITIPIDELAEKAGFKPLKLLNSERFWEKERVKFKISHLKHKSIFDSGSKRVMREFYLLQK